MTYENKTGFAAAVKRHAKGIDPNWPFASEFVMHAKALAELWCDHQFDKATPALVIAVPDEMRRTLADYFTAQRQDGKGPEIHAIGRDYVAINHNGVFVKFSPLEHITEEHRPATPPRLVCPLPEVGEWGWGNDPCLQGKASEVGDWTIAAWKDVDGWWDWNVSFQNSQQCEGITRTRRGAMRAAEKAARRAWAVRNP